MGEALSSAYPLSQPWVLAPLGRPHVPQLVGGWWCAPSVGRGGVGVSSGMSGTILWNGGSCGRQWRGGWWCVVLLERYSGIVRSRGRKAWRYLLTNLVDFGRIDPKTLGRLWVQRATACHSLSAFG